MTSSGIVDTVVAQHSDDAAFSWLLRDAAVRQPHYSLEDLAKLDDQVDAHLDGLRIAGDAGWKICKAAMAWKEPGEIFTVGVLAFESGAETRIQLALEATLTEPTLCRGLVSALGWLPFSIAERHLKSLTGAESSLLRCAGIAAAAIQRQNFGWLLRDAVLDSDPLLRARALRAVGELGRLDHLSLAGSHLKADNDEVRFSAAWSLALLSGDASALTVLRSIVESTAPRHERALQMAMRRMALPSAKAWQRELAQNAAHIRSAVVGVGVIGDPQYIPWLIEQMTIPALARVAGEAFTMITGVDIAYEDLEGEWPEGFEAGPTENPEDDNVEMDPDENLSWPDPELIQHWWNTHRGSFQAGTRYLLGRPISIEWLHQVLRIGRQRQRAAAALELAIRQPGTPLFEVRAPGFRQKQVLGL